MDSRAAEHQSFWMGAGQVLLAHEPDFALGELKVRPSLLQVQREGDAVTVEPRVMQVLVALAQAQGQVVGRSELIDRCWAGRVVGDNAINRVVSHLRRLAATFGSGSFEIETIPRVGYRLNVALRAPAHPTDVPSQAAPAPVDGSGLNPPSSFPAPALGPSPVAAGRRRWMSVALAAGAFAGMAGSAWWAWRRTATPMTAAAGITLAVLPFRPLNEEGRDKLLEAGMADSLIARLSAVPGLAVRSMGSALRFGGPRQDPLAAAHELDAAWIVDGTLERSGERLRATARLLRAADGVAAWNGNFAEEKRSAVFDIQDQISGGVMQALVALLGAESTSAQHPIGETGGTRNADAYQLYLAAMWHAQGQRAEDIALALRLLDQALASDPDYALAWVGLARTHRRSLWIDALPSSAFEPANAALAHALALTPKLADARAELGYSAYWFGYDWPRAEREFRAALSTNPSVATAHFGLAQLLLTQDRIDEGMLHMRMTRELDPLSPVFNAVEASFLLDLGHVAEASGRLQRALDIAPNLWLSHVARGMLLLAQDHPDDALGALRKAAQLGGNISRPQAVLGVQLAAMGRRDETRQILLRLQAQSRERYVPLTSLAALHAALGETDSALNLLEEAYRVRDTRLIYLKDDPHWRDLREQPRFLALKKRLGLDNFGRGLSPV